MALSVAVNASPLMRYDGYFVLCDLTGMENLQPRSLTLLSWGWRRVIAGSDEATPEPGLSHGTHALLMAFGAALGLYRASLYAGIAYGLMAFVFPALGLVLAALMVVCFLGWPLAFEGLRWFKAARKRLGPATGPLRVLTVLVLLGLPMVVPWRTALMVPVLLRLGEAHAVFAPESGVIARVAVTDGQPVRAGQVLVEMTSPDLMRQLTAARLKSDDLGALLDQRLTQADTREDQHVEVEEIRRSRIEISGLESRLARLILRAPSDGIVRDVDDGLKAGEWVADDHPLLRVVDTASADARAYIDERDVGLVAAGARGTIWLEGSPLGRVPLRVRVVYDQAVPRIESAIVAGPGGGPIPVKQAADRSLVPESATYEAELDVTECTALGKIAAIETRGYALIETSPRNLIGRIWDRIVGVWRRELG